MSIKVITRQDMVATAADRWKIQYGASGSWYTKCFDGTDTKAVYNKLRNATTVEEINTIIGNDSWTTVPMCTECSNNKADYVIHIKHEFLCSDDMYLCPDCINKLVRLSSEDYSLRIMQQRKDLEDRIHSEGHE